MGQFDFITLRLGKTSVPDINKINALPCGIVQDEIVINVTSTQVPAEVGSGYYAFVWLGSDNSKGQATEWKQGFKAFGQVIGLSRGEKWSDESTTSVKLLYVFPEAVTRLDLLKQAPREYYYCSAAPIIGLDDHSNQTVRLFIQEGERCDVTAFFYALGRITPSFKSDLISINPDFHALFSFEDNEKSASLKAILPPTPDDLKRAFQEYLRDPGRFKGQNTASQYWSIISSERAELQFLRDIISNVTNGRTESIFAVYNENEADRIYKDVLEAPENSFQNQIVSAILGWYKKFLSEYLLSWGKDIAKIANVPLQIIYYGAPGTGKSFKIKHEIIPNDIEPYRVTFYSDYYYSDFVGGLRPRKGENGIDYCFEPGPFARALKDSFFKPTYLNIEEINRGNAAAIFGDIFQLLDRKYGQSEYSITNHDLYKYLVDEGVIGLEYDKVYIPANLHILCTMNTADQNVFVLDTAFKRRFKMEYVPINFNAFYEGGNRSMGIKETCKGYLDNISVFNGLGYEGDLKVLMTPDVYNDVTKTVGLPQRDWRTFASFVNARIDAINKVEQKISEDKKLGPFFVDSEELKDRKAFADKVLYYLKQDVFKYEDSILEDSYEVLYDRFVNKNEDIFMMISQAR